MTLTRALTVDLTAGLTSGLTGFASLYGPNLMIDPAQAPIATVDWSYDAGSNVLTRTGSSGGVTFNMANTEDVYGHLVSGATYLMEYDISGWTGDSWSIRSGGSDHLGQLSGNGHFSHIMQPAGANESVQPIAWGGGAAAAVWSNISFRKLISDYGPEMMDQPPMTVNLSGDWSWDEPTAILTRSGNNPAAGSLSFQHGTRAVGVMTGDTCLVEYDVTGWAGDSWKVLVGGGANTTEQSGDGHYSHILTVGASDELALTTRINPWFGNVDGTEAIFSNITSRKIL